MRSTAKIRLIAFSEQISAPVFPGVIVLGVALEHPCRELELSGRVVIGLLIENLYTVLSSRFSIKRRSHELSFHTKSFLASK